MSLETEVKKLTEAILGLTSAIQASQVPGSVAEETEEVEDKPAKAEKPKSTRKTRTTKAKSKPEPEPEEDDDDLDDDDDLEEDEVTVMSVKALAKEKINDGAVEKADVKAKIKELGASSMADLDQKGLNKLFSYLEDL